MTHNPLASVPHWYGYTPEEVAEALILYEAHCEQLYEGGYAGDFGCGLSFAMQTYNPICWRQFFKRDPPHTGVPP